MTLYDEKTQKVLDEVAVYYGRIPNTYYGTSDAGVLPRLWALAGVTFVSGAADHEDKRICAAVAAHTIGLPGLVQAHYMILKKEMGWNRQELDSLLYEQYPKRMNNRQIQYAKLAKSLAVNPTQVDEQLLESINKTETKEAIAEVVALVGFVRYMATFVSVYDK